MPDVMLRIGTVEKYEVSVSDGCPDSSGSEYRSGREQHLIVKACVECLLDVFVCKDGDSDGGHSRRCSMPVSQNKPQAGHGESHHQKDASCWN